MALIKCKECGHEVSDKASSCPNCGCPIENNNCVECGQPIPDGVDECPNCGFPIEKVKESQEDVLYEEPKKKKGWIWALCALLLCLGGAGSYYFFIKSNKGGNFEVDNDFSQSINGKYAIVLYNDNFGEFYNTEGGRLCSFELSDGRKEPMTLRLSQSLNILGKSTDRLYLSSNRLFADYSDYLDFNSSYKPNKELGVAVEYSSTDDANFYIVKFENGQIEDKHVPLHQIKPKAGTDYVMLYYNDEYGTLYDSKGQRLCGVRKGTTIVGDLKVKLSKTINVYGVSTSELSIKGDNLYTTEHDLIDDKFKRDDEPSKRVATVVRTDDKDATIYSFSKAGIANDNGKGNVSTQRKSSQWNITSEDELRRKIVGTIWTCRPRGGTWYRLVFTQDNLKLYYATPSQGQWKEEHSKIWNWHTNEGYTSDTGEKCFSIQITEPGNNFSFGALIFFKNGDIEFNWLRGKEGGNAECKDFNWE